MGSAVGPVTIQLTPVDGGDPRELSPCPSGRFIAISTTNGLNIGGIPDTVLVRRTSEGGEVFRKTLPAYARSDVAFLGEHHFAYTGIS